MPTSKHGAITATWESGIDFDVPNRKARATKRTANSAASASTARAAVQVQVLVMPDASADLWELLVGLLLVSLFVLSVWR